MKCLGEFRECVPRLKVDRAYQFQGLIFNEDGKCILPQEIYKEIKNGKIEFNKQDKALRKNGATCYINDYVVVSGEEISFMNRKTFLECYDLIYQGGW